MSAGAYSCIGRIAEPPDWNAMVHERPRWAKMTPQDPFEGVVHSRLVGPEGCRIVVVQVLCPEYLLHRLGHIDHPTLLALYNYVIGLGIAFGGRSLT